MPKISNLRFVALLIGAALYAGSAFEDTSATWPSTRSASDIYLAAAGMIKAQSPAETDLTFDPSGPAFDLNWQKIEKDSWDQGPAIRDLVRQARVMDQTDWPEVTGYLNQCRSLANELGDAAEYAHLQGDQVEAVELIKDMLHMSELMRGGNAKGQLIRLLVGNGVEALAMD